MNKLVYIIPTYNEKENIEQMLLYVERILKKIKGYKSSIVVVDDNSPDGTGNIVSVFKKKYKNVYLLSGPKRGLGNAVIRGIKSAINTHNANIIVINEADFSYDPKNIIKMVSYIDQGADAVFAARSVSTENHWSAGRQIMHFVSNTLFANFLAGINKIEDHNSAFKVIRVRGILDKINFKNFPSGFVFFNYLNYQILKRTDKVEEIKVVYRPRKAGESKINLKSKNIIPTIKEVWEYFATCLRIRIEKIKEC